MSEIKMTCIVPYLSGHMTDGKDYLVHERNEDYYEFIGDRGVACVANKTFFAEPVKRKGEITWNDEAAMKFVDWVSQYFGRKFDNDGVLGPWYSLDDLLNEEPRTTQSLLEEFTYKPENP